MRGGGLRVFLREFDVTNGGIVYQREKSHIMKSKSYIHIVYQRANHK